MAHDVILEQRIQDLLGDRTDLVAKRMFGGVGFMLQGNMACGVHKDYLIVRVGLEAYEGALAEPHASEFDMTGRPMRGWVTVSAEGLQSDEQLNTWVHKGINFALSLPAK